MLRLECKLLSSVGFLIRADCHLKLCWGNGVQSPVGWESLIWVYIERVSVAESRLVFASSSSDLGVSYFFALLLRNKSNWTSDICHDSFIWVTRVTNPTHPGGAHPSPPPDKWRHGQDRRQRKDRNPIVCRKEASDWSDVDDSEWLFQARTRSPRRRQAWRTAKDWFTVWLV